MKKLIIILALSIIIFTGCDSESIVSPNEESILQKGSTNIEQANPVLGQEDFNFPFFRKSYTVNGSYGGILYWNENFTNKKGEEGMLNAVLTIPAGAFEGELTFDVIFSLEDYSMELYPTPFKFNKPVKLTLFYFNVDLDKNADDLDFAYLDGAGEKVNYAYKEIDVEKGNIFVWSAELHHFSRYGWTRTKDIIKNREKVFIAQ